MGDGKPNSVTSRHAVGRRDVLKLLGVAGAAAGTLPVASASAACTVPAATTGAAGHHHHHAVAPANSDARRTAYAFFNADESAFVEAAVDTLIPGDAAGPGALELGVATYIDRQMAGAYGKGDRLYLAGPFAEGTPSQGYQLPLTPSELLRTGIGDVQAHTQDRHGASFETLSAEDRTAVMAGLDSGEIELPTAPAFFDLLLQLTIEGYFADPLYGGNRDKAAWKMIGFPGADTMYADKIEPFRNRPYTAEPLGIQDLI